MSRRHSRAAAPRHRLRTARPARRTATSAALLGALVAAGLATGAASDQEQSPVVTAGPVEPPCPAYLGPQCAGPAHDRWATGQAAAALAP